MKSLLVPLACHAHALKPRLPRRFLLLSAALMLAPAHPLTAQGTLQPPAADTITEAREALRQSDRARLERLRAQALQQRHPLAMWVDYWSLQQQLPSASPAQVHAFLERWPGTYVAERLRTDWLAELGRRRDWSGFAQAGAGTPLPEDAEVACYSLLLRHAAGEDIAAAARARWLGPQGTEDGCALLAATLLQQRRLAERDVWLKLRETVTAGRTQATRVAAALLGREVSAAVDDLLRQPSQRLARLAASGAGPRTQRDAELLALALARLGDSDAATAALLLENRWSATLPPQTLAWTWAALARQAAVDLHPQATTWYHRAANVPGAGRAALSDDLLAWEARAVLRAGDAPHHWDQLQQAIEAMSRAQQQEPAWVYWHARALRHTAPPVHAGAARRDRAAAQFEALAGQMHFYGQLAAGELGRPLRLPPRPTPLTAAERARAAAHAGLTRSLALIGLGLRDEGVREWNFSLRGMNDRALRAAAQRACAAEVWDRCINTSERTRGEIDLQQRYPTPLRAEVEAMAQEAGLDPAYVYAVIRQESRFVADARSAVGAAGLMQLMPATASATARRIGLQNFHPGQVTHAQTNLRLGTHYLRQVLDELGGSLVLAAAAYNAGPSRPRRWQGRPGLEAAAWIEGIPFGETREYVKKVLSGTACYAAMLNGQVQAGAAQAPAAMPGEDLRTGTCEGLPPGACPVRPAPQPQVDIQSAWVRQ